MSSSNFLMKSNAFEFSANRRSRNHSGVSSRAPKCFRKVAAAVVAVVRLQELAPRLQADLLSRVARLQQVGGQPADGSVVVVGQENQLVDGQVAGVGPAVLGGIGAGVVGGGIEEAEHGLVQAERSEGGLLELRHVVQDPDHERVDRLALDADQPGHPGRLDLAERAAEVGL